MELKIKETYQGKEIKGNGIIIDQNKPHKFEYYYNNGFAFIFEQPTTPCPNCIGEGCPTCAGLGYIVQTITPVNTPKKKKGCTSCK